jgi:hypothetical protein
LLSRYSLKIVVSPVRVRVSPFRDRLQVARFLTTWVCSCGSSARLMRWATGGRHEPVPHLAPHPTVPAAYPTRLALQIPQRRVDPDSCASTSAPASPGAPMANSTLRGRVAEFAYGTLTDDLCLLAARIS